MAYIGAMTKEKVYTEGAAFSIGVFNGIVGRARPGAALLTTVVTAAGGLFGSLMTRGTMADIMEGVAAGSLGALGYSLPFWLKPEETSSRVSVKSIRKVREVAAPKALKSGNGAVASVGADYAKEFQNVKLY